MTVVSGLARGIDTAAHKAALDSGGRTIAVLGTGITRCYPPENRDLAEQIAHAGAAVSHFRPSWPPGKDTFPRRNVVTSGLSHGTVVMPYLLATEAFYGELSRNGMSQYLVGLRELPKAVGCVWHYDFVSSDQNAVQGDFGEAWLEVVAAGSEPSSCQMTIPGKLPNARRRESSELASSIERRPQHPSALASGARRVPARLWLGSGR